MGKFQDPLLLSLQGDQKILENFQNWGYVADVHAAQANAELFTEMQQDHTLALANLETATQYDRTSVALLTKMILELSIQVALLSAKLATLQAEKARMKKIGQ